MILTLIEIVETESGRKTEEKAAVRYAEHGIVNKYVHSEMI